MLNPLRDKNDKNDGIEGRHRGGEGKTPVTSSLLVQRAGWKIVVVENKPINK